MYTRVCASAWLVVRDQPPCSVQPGESSVANARVAAATVTVLRFILMPVSSIGAPRFDPRFCNWDYVDLDQRISAGEDVSFKRGSSNGESHEPDTSVQGCHCDRNLRVCGTVLIRLV